MGLRHILKLVLLLAFRLTFTLPVLAQSSDFVAAGASYQQTAPQVTGWAVYAKPITQGGLYSFSEYDVLPRSVKPIVLDSSVRTGLAQRVFNWAPASVYVCADAGAAVSGESVGGSFGACGLAAIALGKTKWSIVAGVSGIKSSLSDPTVVLKLGIGRTR